MALVVGQDELTRHKSPVPCLHGSPAGTRDLRRPSLVGTMRPVCLTPVIDLSPAAKDQLDSKSSSKLATELSHFDRRTLSQR